MKKIMFLILGIAIFMTGCTAATPTVSPLERSQMRTATIDASYDITFRALMTTLEDQGYTIDNTDMQSGLIKASIAKDATDNVQKFFGTTGVDTYEVSSTVSKINKNTTKVRINIREKTDMTTSTTYGSNNSTTAKEIDDPAVYHDLFNNLKTEIARSKAMK